MKILIFLAFAVVVYLISVPLHEFFHVFIAKCLGSKDKLKITWLRIERTSGLLPAVYGRVEVCNQERFPNFPDRWYTRNPKSVQFIFGFFGGFGAAVVLVCLGIFVLSIGGFLYIWMPLFLNAAFQLFYGICEGLVHYLSVEKSPQ